MQWSQFQGSNLRSLNESYNLESHVYDFDSHKIIRLHPFSLSYLPRHELGVQREPLRVARRLLPADDINIADEFKVKISWEPPFAFGRLRACSASRRASKTWRWWWSACSRRRRGPGGHRCPRRRRLGVDGTAGCGFGCAASAGNPVGINKFMIVPISTQNTVRSFQSS